MERVPHTHMWLSVVVLLLFSNKEMLGWTMKPEEFCHKKQGGGYPLMILKLWCIGNKHISNIKLKGKWWKASKLHCCPPKFMVSFTNPEINSNHNYHTSYLQIGANHKQEDNVVCNPITNCELPSLHVMCICFLRCSA